MTLNRQRGLNIFHQLIKKKTPARFLVAGSFLFIHPPVVWCFCLFVSEHSGWIKPLCWPLQQNPCVLPSRIWLIVIKARRREGVGLKPALLQSIRDMTNISGMDNAPINGQWPPIRKWYRMCLGEKCAVDGRRWNERCRDAYSSISRHAVAE